jgi:hypothetical protein
MTNKYHASWTMFGRGYRTDLDETDPETQQLAQRIRREIALEFSRGELQQSLGNKGMSDGENKDGDMEDDVEMDDRKHQPSKQTDATSTAAPQLMPNSFIISAPHGNPNSIHIADERQPASLFEQGPAHTAPTSAAFATPAGYFTGPEVNQKAVGVDKVDYQEQRAQRSGAGFLGGMRDKATGLVEQPGGKSKHSKGKDGKL